MFQDEKSHRRLSVNLPHADPPTQRRQLRRSDNETTTAIVTQDIRNGWRIGQ
jgi:hypothetical protein